MKQDRDENLEAEVYALVDETEKLLIEKAGVSITSRIVLSQLHRKAIHIERNLYYHCGWQESKGDYRKKYPDSIRDEAKEIRAEIERLNNEFVEMEK